MASYPPPTSVVSIYNPSLYPDKDQPITENNANLKYVQTGTAVQTVRGVKGFDNLNINGQNPLTWFNSPTSALSSLSPSAPTWSQTYLLPNYTAPTLDTLVARTSSQTLTNKILQTLQVGTNGTSVPEIRFGTTAVQNTTTNTGLITVNLSPSMPNNNYQVFLSVLDAGFADRFVLSVSSRNTGSFVILWRNVIDTGTTGSFAAQWMLIGA